MDLIEMNKTELCYITAKNVTTRTFFAQLCKNTNESLINFNIAIGDYCQRVLTNKYERLIKLAHKGDVVCARYPKDNSWYRAVVLDKNKTERDFSVFFTDFGNVEVLPYDDIILPDIEKLPIIKRSPFGVPCFLENSEQYNAEQIDHLLEILYDSYVMLKFLGRQTKLQWKVSIPKHAYNMQFWCLFRPGQFAQESDAAKSGQVEDIKKIEAK